MKRSKVINALICFVPGMAVGSGLKLAILHSDIYYGILCIVSAVIIVLQGACLWKEENKTQAENKTQDEDKTE